MLSRLVIIGNGFDLATREDVLHIYNNNSLTHNLPSLPKEIGMCPCRRSR